MAPFFFGLINSEVGAKKQAFRGRGWAVFALAVILGLWGWRWVERDSAIVLASAEDAGGPQLRVFANPYPGNPYHWDVIVETPDRYQIFSADTRRNLATSSPQTDVVYKPPTTLATLAAKRSYLGEIYLDWSQYPMVEETGIDADGVATVTFRDLRFMFKTFLTPGLGSRDHPPLMGTVEIGPDRRVLSMEFNGRPQK